MDRFDFIVIGGGMMGAPCARHLAEAGHRVALLAPPEPPVKSRSQGPFGSHYDAARITRRVAADADWSRLSCRSIERYADLEARSGLTIFHETGALMAGPDEGTMADGFTRRFQAVAAALPQPPPVLDTCETWERLGIALPCGSVATLEATQGGWIDPRAMRDAQITLACTAGATLIPQAAVDRDGGTVTLADGTAIAGAQIVVATGPHAGSDGLLPRVPQMKVWARTIAFARLSEETGAALSNMPSVIFVPQGWDHDLYVLPPVRYPDGRLYLKIGGQLDGPRIRSATQMRDWFHGTGDGELGTRLLEQLRSLLPGTAFEATHTEPCAVVWTASGYPTIERLDETVTALIGGNGAAAKCGDELGRLGAMVAQGRDIGGEGYATDFAGTWQDGALAAE
ncbi:FAD-dependent oxidoreductase [Jannaschia donghaensis]|uniref:Monomeric sarcosine oxidase n=1 Tax=Jannaschia donghaensis TaxID=420998 RepID=A0A0M6YIP4_9RHOB|nr:FAD-dependent oxidoreductase [Jannaschia donghaensis]CTQ49820.1 Monomeric sarcosine oxidase [Jannaschia donghaensis]